MTFEVHGSTDHGRLVLDELGTAGAEKEGISIQTAGLQFAADVLVVTEAP